MSALHQLSDLGMARLLVKSDWSLFDQKMAMNMGRASGPHFSRANAGITFLFTFMQLCNRVTLGSYKVPSK